MAQPAIYRSDCSRHQKADCLSSQKKRRITLYVLWVGALAAASFLSLDLAAVFNSDSQRILRIVSGLLPAAAAVPMAQGCWVRYHTVRQISWMFAAQGFTAYAILCVLGMVSVGIFGVLSSSDTVMSLALWVSQLAAGVLWAIAAFSTAVVPSGCTRAVATRSLLTAALGTVVVLIAISGLDSLAPKLTSELAAYTASGTEQWELRWKSTLGSFHIAGLYASSLAFVLGIIGYWRKGEEEGGLTCAFPYWLTAMALSSFLQAVVAREGGFIWVAPAILTNIGAMQLICAFGADAASAYRSSFYRTTELRSVHGVSSAVSGTKTVPEAAQAVVESITDILQAELAAIFLATGENSVKLIAAHGAKGILPKVGNEYPLISQARSGFHTSNTALAFREQRIITIPEALTEADFVPWRLAAKVKGYVVCIPLIRRGKCLGVLDIMFPASLSFLASRETLFSMIADTAASAMEERLSEGSIMKEETAQSA